jgi:hypothetical protein
MLDTYDTEKRVPLRYIIQYTVPICTPRTQYGAEYPYLSIVIVDYVGMPLSQSSYNAKRLIKISRRTIGGPEDHWAFDFGPGAVELSDRNSRPWRIILNRPSGGVLNFFPIFHWH